jgi:membrane protein YdbS with pleckstrin-like domain
VTGSDPFAVPGAEWSRVSPRLTALRRVLVVVVTSAALAAVVAVGVLAPSARLLAVLVGVAVVALAGWGWWFTALSVAAWGWVEREQDLVVTRGRLWRRLDVVPYGRMQLVDVTAGPLQRFFGITTVRLHTASPSSRAHLPGLSPDDASRLREQLTARGEAHAAGL